MSVEGGVRTPAWSGIEQLSKLGIGHGRLLIVLGGVLARLSPGLSVIPGAERICSTVLHSVAVWTIVSVVTGLGYAVCRTLLSRALLSR
jgi:preprotein translocase subunit SecY